MQDEILKLAYEVSRVTEEKIGLIDSVVRQTHLLSLNSRIEAARAGAAGAPFSVVAHEMGVLAKDISEIADQLRSAISSNTALLRNAGAELVEQFRGARFTDLAHNAIEIIDRNLYERSCDVRWWATEAAFVAALEGPSTVTEEAASARLATILRSYTVYLDLWVANRDGVVVAIGRPERYRHAIGARVRGEAWFERAMATADGNEFVVSDISTNAALGGAAVATYSTAIRGGGDTHGEPIGALGIFFDWAPQAAAVVQGVSLSAAERASSRVMLLDADCRVIAASDGRGLLSERYPLRTDGRDRGYYKEGDRLVAFARTPGYETYRGLGWLGVIEWIEAASVVTAPAATASAGA